MELKINFTGMEIGLYIEEILKEHGKVSIPGVGTFYNNKIPAYFDPEQQIFFPPSRKLNFKLVEEGNTSIFSEFISKEENISVVAADRIVNKFAAKFITELGTTGTAEIEGLGKLKREGVDYVFETFPFYGLDPLGELDIILPEINSGDYGLKDEVPLFTAEAPGIKIQEPEVIEPEEIRHPESDVPQNEQEEEPETVLQPSSVISNKADEEEDYLAFRLRQREEENTREPDFKEQEEQIKEPDLRKAKVRELSDEEIRAAQMQAADIFQNLIQDREHEKADDIEEIHTSSWKKWLLISMAILFVIAAALLYVFYPQITEFRQRFKSVEIRRSQVPVVADTLPAKPADSIINQTPAPADSQKSVANSTKLSLQPVTFEIVIYRSDLKSDIEKYLKDLKNKPKDTHIVENPESKFKYAVSVASFKDMASAEAGKALALKDLSTDITKYAQIQLIPSNPK